MDVKFWSEVAQSQAVWAICCILLAVVALIILRKDIVNREKERSEREDEFRKASEKREDKLMTHLERSNESQERTAATLDTMSRTLQAVEGRVEIVEKMLYRREV